MEMHYINTVIINYHNYKGEMAIIFFPRELCMISIVAVNQNFLFYFLAPIAELSAVLKSVARMLCKIVETHTQYL